MDKTTALKRLSDWDRRGRYVFNRGLQEVAARTLDKPKFYDFLAVEISGLLQQLQGKMGIGLGSADDAFKM